MPVLIHSTAYDALIGYFPRGDREAAEFGSLSWVLRDLSRWVDGKAMRDTKTFEQGAESDVPTAYCLDIAGPSRHGNYLVTTWNEVPMADGGVATAGGDSRVGALDVSIAEINPGDIPGYPTYFYCVPGKELVATIRPDGRRHNGHAGFDRYLQSYMTFFSSATVYSEENDQDDDADLRPIGYKDPDDRRAEPVKLVPVFRTKIRRLLGQIEYLRDNRERIRKLVRRDHLKMLDRHDRSLLEKLLQSVGLANVQVADNLVKLAFDIEFSPSEQELETMIGRAGQDAAEDAEVGFALQGDSEIFWLNHSFQRDDIAVEVIPTAAEVLPAGGLLSELDRTLHNSL